MTLKPEISRFQSGNINIIVVSAFSFQTSEAASVPIVIETTVLKPIADLEIAGETAAEIATLGRPREAESLERLQ